jgi:guanine deaminase
MPRAGRKDQQARWRVRASGQGDGAGCQQVAAYRGEILHFSGDPERAGAVHHHVDGVLLVRAGRILAAGDAAELLRDLPPATALVDYRPALILPGFIDAHVHYPQTDIIASAGARLFDWLEQHVYPAERRFADAGHAGAVAGFFLDELVRNGTTSAMVFATVHAQSVDAFFAAAQARDLRMIAGKVLMDRNVPEDLRDGADGGYADSAALIARWHGRGRLRYAVTPRFAVSCSERQLQLCARLLAEHPDVHVHSHLAEHRAEVARVFELFPGSRSYLDVYDRYGLLRPGAVYAHGIHIDATDRHRMAESGAAIAHCPSSNLFLGSGLFDGDGARAAGVTVGLGTDVGAGTSLSMLRTMGDAWKVARLAGGNLSPLRAFHLATLGSARALGIDDCVGSFLPGREADFTVLDWASTPLMARRMASAGALAERLLVLMTLGDERAVRATHVAGRCAWRRPAD